MRCECAFALLGGEAGVFIAGSLGFFVPKCLSGAGVIVHFGGVGKGLGLWKGRCARDTCEVSVRVNKCQFIFITPLLLIIGLADCIFGRASGNVWATFCLVTVLCVFGFKTVFLEILIYSATILKTSEFI